MTLKNFKIVLLTLIFGAAAAGNTFAAGAESKKGAPFPVLNYAGIIPVQWSKDESWQDISNARKLIDQEFFNAVKDSHRFSMINDELVASLWRTPAGRNELESDYELNAFLSLDVSARGDLVVLTTRLLSPKLETRLQESEVISRKWIAESSRDQTSSRLTDLVHRMINRLPVDIHVTSVNGSYVTLSGGEEQGLKAGQKFDVLKSQIESLHPANGSWLTFASFKTGQIEVIELKSRSSIARIVSLTHEGSIKPGNGVRVEDISGRNRFARAEEIPTDTDTATELAASSHPKPEPPEIILPASEAKPDQKIDASKKDEAKPEADAVAEEKKPETPADSAPDTDSFTASLMPKGSEIRSWLGMKMWSISGSATAAAGLPFWILNSGGADIYRKFSDTIDFNYGLDLGYGPTKSGSFFGYDIHGGGRWHMYKKDVLPGADDIYFGLLTSVASTSISGESSGGYSMNMVRLQIGVHGWAKPDFIGEKVEWTGEMYYPLYYSGQFGVKGSYKAVTSGSSMAFRIGGYTGNRSPDVWQYGAAFDYEGNSWSLEKGKTASYSSIGLSLLARRNI
jgi:hypothetical protein